MIGIKIPLEVKIYLGVLLILAWLGSLAVANLMGRHHVQAKWDATKHEGKTAVQTLVKESGRVSTIIKTVYVDRLKIVKEKGDAIVKQVPIYIPANSCDLPGGFRILHDAAVDSTIPDPTEGIDGDPVPLREATATVTKNYATCNAAIVNLTGLREWLKKQAEVYRALCAEKPELCSKDK